MEFSQLLLERHSVRRYKNLMIDIDKLSYVLDAARLSPSSGNKQPYYFIVVKEKEKREKIAEAADQLWMISAPIHIVLVSDLATLERYYGKRGKEVYSFQNTAIAGEHMLLAAAEINLGACFVSSFDEKKVAEILELKSDYRADAIITLGYSKEDEIIETKPKKELSVLVYFDKFGNKSDTTVLKSLIKKLKKTVSKES